MGAHIFDPAAEIDPQVDRVHRTDCVGDRALRVLADCKRCFHSGFEIAHVVQGIEDAENVHAVCGCPLDESLDKIVGVMAIAEDILAALGLPLPYTADGGNLTVEFTVGAENVRGAAQVFSDSLAFGTYPMQVIP